MTDLVDKAQELEQRQRDDALKLAAMRPVIVGRVCCIVCGGAIEPLRTALGAQRCIDCQTSHEASAVYVARRGVQRK